MSSSGLIYAFIVGAWAVYLVPMWLRREDELNKARQTQRYTTAIKVLSHKDSFERKHGAAAEKEEARELPAAAGQAGASPAAGQLTLERVRAKEREQARERAAGGARGGSVAARAAGAARGAGAAVSATVRPATSSAGAGAGAAAATGASVPASGAASVSGAVSATASASGSASSASARAANASAGQSAQSAQSDGARSVLRARRRRVVGVLFALTSLGAIVSADLGLGYVWAMLLPAAVLSAYIVRVRKDERARAEERARRRAAAVKAAREAERRRVELQREREEAVRREREDLARRNVAARRRVAAARARADRRITPGAPRPDQGDLPRAANG